MQRMTQINHPGLSSFPLIKLGRISRVLLLMGAVFAWSVASTTNVDAQVVQADYDYQASGFLTPTGGAPPSISRGVVGGVMQAGYYPGESGSSSSSCDSGSL